MISKQFEAKEYTMSEEILNQDADAGMGDDAAAMPAGDDTEKKEDEGSSEAM